MGKQLTADICRTLLSNMRKAAEYSPLSMREGYFFQALEKSLKQFERDEARAKRRQAATQKSDCTLKNPAKK